MDLALIIIMIMSAIGIIICLIGMYKCDKAIRRNREVARFKYMLGDMAHSYNMRHIKEIGIEDVHKVWSWFADKWTYDELLHSSRPLTLEEWYTKEEIERINA